VGTFERAGKTTKPAVSGTVATAVMGNGGSEVTLRGVQCVRLPITERRRRVAVLLRTMAGVRGGAKQSAHYGDRTPALVILAPIKGGVNPFTRVVRDRDAATFFDVDILTEQIAVWSDELDGPVRIGWAPGFLGSQRERAHSDLAELLQTGQVILGHPRVILNTLASELEAGDHDAWFDDPAA
jgi:CRISPR-associated protein Cst2